MSLHFKRIAGRKAIVLLTDGIDTSSVRATFESTLRSAAEQYALIYPIQYNTYKDMLGKQLSAANSGLGATIYTTPSGKSVGAAYERGSRYLRMMAETSGGRFYYVDSSKNLEHSFARIAEELRQQYSLGYYPKNKMPKKEKRRIKVRVSVPEGVVHARDSYTYKPDSR
jgi:Ca-activated chloride channel family protein